MEIRGLEIDFEYYLRCELIKSMKWTNRIPFFKPWYTQFSSFNTKYTSMKKLQGCVCVCVFLCERGRER